MKAAGPNHSNIILVAVIGSVLGIVIYAGVYWFGGWKTLIGLFLVSALTWALLLVADRWPPH